MLTLTGHTALRVWAADGLADELGWPCRRGVDWGRATMREIRGLGLESMGIFFGEDDPLEVLVRGAESRIQSAKVRNRVWTGELPAGSLYQLAPGVLICCPELCCLQIAHAEGLCGALKAEMECLGRYGVVKSGRGFLDRRALVSKSDLWEYFEAAAGHKGVTTARRALRWVMEGSRSPMETTVALALTLPASLGGYGLPRPELNHLIIPGEADAECVQGECFLVDMCWPDFHTVIEYDSYRYHQSNEAHDHDAMKRNSLVSMGWKVYTATYGQMAQRRLDVFARQVAKAIYRDCQDPDFEAQRGLLKS